MVHILYNPAHPSLLVSGHAGSAPKGHDLVCAAVSILVHTLAAHARSLTQAEVLLSSGEAWIAAAPSDEARRTFDTLCTGFSLLARQYPDFVSYEVRG